MRKFNSRLAAHAVLDSFEFGLAQHGAFDAVLIACFGDPGLLALREVAGVPVLDFFAELALEPGERLRSAPPETPNRPRYWWSDF